MKESVLQGAIKTAIEHRYGSDVDVTNYHGTPYSKAGTPDLLLCLYAHYIAIEVKLPARRSPSGVQLPPTDTSPIQNARISRILRAGGAVIVVRSVAEAISQLDSLARRIIPDWEPPL